MANLTLCFLKYQNSILLINRNKAPFMGMWNAIGGHQEKGETLLECAIREIYEETNIKIEKLNFMGKFTWNFDDDIGYIYVGNLEKDFNINNYPLKNKEGIVDFKSIEWIENSHNTGIINDLKIIIPEIFKNQINEYHFIYDEQNQLKSYTIKKIG